MKLSLSRLLLQKARAGLVKKIITNKLGKKQTYTGYKLQDRIKFQGMDISIENKKGSYRKGKDKNGHEWKIKMKYSYGYARKTEGKDGDKLDVYVGDNENAKFVYVIHQNDPDSGQYDEDKCMLGFNSKEEAKKAYLAHYDRPGFFGSMTEMSIEEFKKKAYKTLHGSKKTLKALLLEKARITKYDRRYKKGGKWIYIYKKQIIKRKKKWIDKLLGMPDTTYEKYFVNDKPTSKRKILHDKIIEEIVSKTKSVPINKIPVAIMTMGGPASGKSSMVKSAGVDSEKFVVADADAVKEKIPEYNKSIIANARNAAFMAHKESSYIVNKIRNVAIDDNKNIIIDGTGSVLHSYLDNLKKLKEKGYAVKLLAVDIDVEIAVKRAMERAEKRGRFVPENVIREKYATIPKNIMIMSKLLDDFSVYDNNGISPKIVWSKKEGSETIHNKEWYAKFLKKINMSKALNILLRKGGIMKTEERELDIDFDTVEKKMVAAIMQDNEELKKLKRKYNVEKGEYIIDVPYELED